MRSKLNGTIQEFVSKALDAYMKEKENQDSLSCFQENQETEPWPNFAVWSDFKNQENQDFKSWKSWSKKLKLATNAH
ncbi:hypothetical protein Gotur_032060 [Gossypium turneri]